jgi:hypothetical protein
MALCALLYILFINIAATFAAVFSLPFCVTSVALLYRTIVSATHCGSIMHVIFESALGGGLSDDIVMVQRSFVQWYVWLWRGTYGMNATSDASTFALNHTTHERLYASFRSILATVNSL